MKPRIIGGSAKDIKLEVPKGTRPITEQAKSAMFSMLSDDILDKRILDLFAGSGSIGLEALSRGAKSCTFVDKGYHIAQMLKKNIDRSGLSGQSQVVKMGVSSFIDSQITEEYDIIFSDPPFKYFKKRNYIENFIKRLSSLIPDGGGIIIKHPNKVELPDTEELVLADTRCFGQMCFSIWVKMKSISPE